MRVVQKRLGWTEVGDNEECDLVWTDTSISEERLLQLRGIQARQHPGCTIARLCDTRPGKP